MSNQFRNVQPLVIGRFRDALKCRIKLKIQDMTQTLRFYYFLYCQGKVKMSSFGKVEMSSFAKKY
jgi:hypothetical protein